MEIKNDLKINIDSIKFRDTIYKDGIARTYDIRDSKDKLNVPCILKSYPISGNLILDDNYLFTNVKGVLRLSANPSTCNFLSLMYRSSEYDIVIHIPTFLLSHKFKDDYFYNSFIKVVDYKTLDNNYKDSSDFIIDRYCFKSGNVTHKHYCYTTDETIVNNILNDLLYGTF